MKLTTRQREIARLMDRGIPRQEIANLLGVSPRTIDAHRQNIRMILGLSSERSTTVALVRKAKRTGVLA